MKKKRHTTEEIIRILRKADEGQTVEEVCREVNISEQTFYRWRRKYGRMEMADAKRFKELENENSELKKMLADEMLKNRVLNETLKKSGERLREASGGEAGGGGRGLPGAPSMPLPRTAPLQVPIPRHLQQGFRAFGFTVDDLTVDATPPFPNS